MKRKTKMRRLVPALALAAGFALPAVAAAGPGPGPVYRPGDTAKVTGQPATSDVFSRYVASHPQGTVTDGRSPDTLSAVAVAHQPATGDVFTRYVASNPQGAVIDGRSPDTLSAVADAQQPVIVDGRSPDTISAAQTPQPVTVVQASGSSFDWGDAAVGAGFGAGILALLAMPLLALTQRRNRLTIKTT